MNCSLPEKENVYGRKFIKINSICKYRQKNRKNPFSDKEGSVESTGVGVSQTDSSKTKVWKTIRKKSIQKNFMVYFVADFRTIECDDMITFQLP